MKKSFLFALFPLLLFSCRSSKLPVVPANAQAPVIIYRTRADYTNKVPVVLDESGKKLLAYPAPSDLYLDGEALLPVKLKKDYLLDRKGIQANTAFTAYTYEEYAALENAPSPGELLDRVIDAAPFTEMYHCGKQGEFTGPVKELNKLIANDFEGCRDLLKMKD